MVTGKVKGKNWYRVDYPEGKQSFVFGTLVKPIDAADLLLWNKVKASRSAKGFKDYLSNFPTGHFANKAKQKVLALVRPAPVVPKAKEKPSPQVKRSATEQNPLSIAVTNFTGRTPGDSKYGRDMSQVIAADLERSGLFRAIDQRAFIQANVPANTLPRFSDWRAVNANALITGRMLKEPDGRLRVEFRLWDSVAEQQLLGRAYFTTPANWRRVAHIIADAIYKRITGELGNFDTRVVYIAESNVSGRNVRRLAIMDQDGMNHRYLTDGSYAVETPRFSPTLQEIAYLSNYRNSPRVYIFNINTGRQEMVGNFPGKTFDPRFSPSGHTVVMSMTRNGNAEIYSMDLRTQAVRKLTQNSANDTSPGYSPDGKSIVFNSDRGGSAQIYIMNTLGNGVKRISFGKGIYTMPAWSPRGDLIAFAKNANGQSFIGVMRPDGSGERLLAQGEVVASPSWSPNGRVLMFSKRTRAFGGGAGHSRLYTINLTGYNERKVMTPMDASQPNWSRSIP